MKNIGLGEPSVVILSGGGLDSGAMTAFAAVDHKAALLLFFNYGQKALVGEYRATNKVADCFSFPWLSIDLPSTIIPSSPLTEGAPVTDLAEQSKNEVKGRNLLLLACTFSFVQRLPSVREIWIGSDRPAIPPGFGDQRQSMFDGFNVTTAVAYGEDVPRVVAPLLHYATKHDFLKEAIEIYPELFADTFSCYESYNEKECGVCNHCQVKLAMADKLRYAP